MTDVKDGGTPTPLQEQKNHPTRGQRTRLLNRLKAKGDALSTKAANEIESKQETLFDQLYNESFSVKAQTEKLARDGFFKGYGHGDPGPDLKLVARYRACQALGWSEAEIMSATGWGASKLKQVREAAKQMAATVDLDAMENWASYKAQQLLVVQQLDEAIEHAKRNFNMPAAVTALKTKSEIFTKILTYGQELGLLNKAQKEIKIEKKVIHEHDAYDADTLRAGIMGMIADLQGLLTEHIGDIKDTPAGAVLKRVLPKAKVIEATEKVSESGSGGGGGNMGD